jgi:hypothetical protein
VTGADHDVTDPDAAGAPASAGAGSGVPEAREVVLGVALSPHVTDGLRAALAQQLPDLLATRMPSRWRVELVGDALVRPPADGLDLLEAARDLMLERDWDLVVALTDLPLKDGRRVLVTQASPVHGVALVSVPALGGTRTRSRVPALVVGLVASLLDLEEDDDPDLVRQRLDQLSSDAAEDDGLQFTARVLGGNLRLLLGMVRANRPWRLAAGLTKSLSIAAATGLLTLVSSDLWLLSEGYGPTQLAVLAVLSVAAVAGTLVIGAKLWERPRARRESRQVALFNAATLATVVIGVLTLFAALFVISALGALVLVDADVYAALTSHALGFPEYLRVALVTASLATVGGALGAGLESDDAVRGAAYTQLASTEAPAEPHADSAA